MSKKILLAEDDAGIIQVMQMVLESSDYEILPAKNEKEVLKILSKDKPGLILLDISLEGTNGALLAKKIKKDYGNSFPIVISSANSETEKIAKEVGADGFILKPFDIDTLLNTVKSYC